MPKLNVEVPADLYEMAKNHPAMSIAKLTRVGLAMALERFPAALLDPKYTLAELVDAPRAPSMVEAMLRKPEYLNNRAPAPAQHQVDASPEPKSSSPSPRTLDPITPLLKPWRDGRKHEWYDVAGLLALTGVQRADLEAVLDVTEDLDRSGDDREVIDAAGIDRLFSTLPGVKVPNLATYHDIKSWLDAR